MALGSKTQQHLKIDERNHVEEPLLQQLEGLGWQVQRLEMSQTPEITGREQFLEVVLLPRLRASLLRINPWLEDDQLNEVIRRLTTLPGNDLIENNRAVLQLLLEGTSVDKNHQTGAISPTVRYVDFETAGNNDFLAVSQFKLRVPGTEKHIYPDITLFLNGLPIGIIECKSPKAAEPIPEAIDQMLRYSEQRSASGEGHKTLFAYNQLLIATCRQIAKFGTLTTHQEKQFYSWSDPYPRTLNDLEHGQSAPNEQQRLVAGMLDHRNLLSLLRTFTLFSSDSNGKTIKIVGRYQQFRAVKKAVKRLLEGGNKEQRGGLIWHTQGSGKSLTMVFLVREMYRHAALMDWKVVFVTDRTQLEEQLGKTVQGIGLTIKVADNIARLKTLLPSTSSDLVMAMIHKFQERELNETFRELNSSAKILILTDEAHRSQYSLLGSNLDRALPNATAIGFTGTPTDKAEKRYKDYIDKYTMRQAIADRVTLEIVYEGRTHNAEVTDRPAMDREFADVFSDYSLSERLQILGYGSRDAYLEARETIAAKARDMVNHYVEQVFPNGFKAQVVATSQEATVRYKAALDKALSEKIAVLENDNPLLIPLEKLRRLQTAVVISAGSHNDLPHIKVHTDSNTHKELIASFKRPFESEENGQKVYGDVGILVVTNMLLTGFDAPIEQVLYLDKNMKNHTLLQAIARVNRVASGAKDKGFVVDYVGIGHHLKEAVDAYDEREQQDIVADLETEQSQVEDLKKAHQTLTDWLSAQGLHNWSDYDAFYDLFYDEEIRFTYITHFKALTRALNVVFPKKEALDFLSNYNAFAEINVMAERHFRDSRLSMKGIPQKLRVLTDAHLKSCGIETRIEPISIFDTDFESEVGKRKRNKTKAAEIEHAIRHEITIHGSEDPDLYASLAEAMEAILVDYKDNWDEIYKRLEELRRKVLKQKNEPTYGLHVKKQMPFFRLLKGLIFSAVVESAETSAEEEDTTHEVILNDEQVGQLVRLTQSVTGVLEQELPLTGFWDNIAAQKQLQQRLKMEVLLSPEFYNLPGLHQNLNAILSRLMETAHTNHDTLNYAS